MFGEERTDASMRRISRERPLSLLKEVTLLEVFQMFLQLSPLTRSFRSNVAEQNFRDVQFENIDIERIDRFIVLKVILVFLLFDFSNSARKDLRTDHNLNREGVSIDGCRVSLPLVTSLRIGTRRARSHARVDHSSRFPIYPGRRGNAGRAEEERGFTIVNDKVEMKASSQLSVAKSKRTTTGITWMKRSLFGTATTIDDLLEVVRTCRYRGKHTAEDSNIRYVGY